MCLPQIINQCRYGNIIFISIEPGKAFSHKVDYNQKGPAVYSIQFTHLLDCLVTEPQRKPKTTHHLQQRIIIADEINHLISWLIFL